MPNIKVVDMAGKEVGEIALSEKVFGKVVKIDAEKNLIAVKGAIPGAKDGIVFLRNSVKA